MLLKPITIHHEFVGLYACLEDQNHLLIMMETCPSIFEGKKKEEKKRETEEERKKGRLVDTGSILVARFRKSDTEKDGFESICTLCFTAFCLLLTKATNNYNKILPLCIIIPSIMTFHENIKMGLFMTYG